MTSELHWTAYATPFIQLVTALLAAFVAIRFGSIQASIARQQAMTAAAAAQTARNKLKFDLFDRRLALYERIYLYIDAVVQAKKLESEKDSEFLVTVKALGWLTSQELVQYVFKELRDKMVELSQVTAELETSPATGQIRVDLMMKQSVLTMNLYQEHAALARAFEPYLKLEH